MKYSSAESKRWVGNAPSDLRSAQLQLRWTFCHLLDKASFESSLFLKDTSLRQED
ncbi:hypothetical protein LguiA_011156 [Lonicera macranthoides]